MTKKYFPILPAKKGECSALNHLNKGVKTNLTPIFEMPCLGSPEFWSKKIAASTTPQLDQLTTHARSIAQNWKSDFHYDITYWAPNATLENGQHVLLALQSQFDETGAKATPVLKFDYWDDRDYQTTLVALSHLFTGHVVIRINEASLADFYDEDFAIGQLDAMVSALNIQRNQVSVLLDFESMVTTSISDAIEIANTVAHVVNITGIENIIIGGSSMPSTINNAVENRDSVGYIIRKEFEVFRYVASAKQYENIGFSDYGVRSPGSPMEGIFPDQNGKIRYTLGRKHLIARGHSLRQGNKFSQFYDLADRVVASGDFMGSGLSWADEQIAAKAVHIGTTGNATTWIAIDTCHHMTVVCDEVRSTLAPESEPLNPAAEIL